MALDSLTAETRYHNNRRCKGIESKEVAGVSYLGQQPTTGKKAVNRREEAPDEAARVSCGVGVGS